MIFPRASVYAITQTEHKSAEQVIFEVEAAIKGGIAVLQYRNKQTENHLYLAGALKELCVQANVMFIINDSATLAKQVGAEGVHIGKGDGRLDYARSILGKQAIIGVSCYNSVELACEAEKGSADYVAFGRFFPSASKPLAALADIETLTQAKKLLTIPIVAIGGILPSNGKVLLNAGADSLAVIGGIFDKNPYQAAGEYQLLFGNNT